MAKESSVLPKPLIIIAFLLVFVGSVVSAGWLGVNWEIVNRALPFLSKGPQSAVSTPPDRIKVVEEENVITDVVDRVSPSVVTVGISQTRRVGDMFNFNPFDPFGSPPRSGGRTQQVEQDIGSGFVISADGLIVTNKHVVSVSGHHNGACHNWFRSKARGPEGRGYSILTTSTDCLAVCAPLVRKTPTIGEMSE